VGFGNEAVDYDVLAAFALPGETVPIGAGPEAAAVTASLGETSPGGSRAPAATPAIYSLRAVAGRVTEGSVNRWNWVAPDRPGLYPIQVARAAGDTVTINVFVMAPYSELRHGAIHGYRIGNYPNPRRGYEAEYQRPRGFVEVTPAVFGAHVSPHFTLGQFVCKEAAGGSTRYLVLRPALIEKLEWLLAAVNDHGIGTPTLSIMSAYRTPAYNAAIGNVTVWSRHEYGDAADVFVDTDYDGVMDDLNHDGKHTIADARVLSAIVDGIEDEPQSAELIGGLGTYSPTSGHGPFVHVDVRGFAVQWAG
jgi:Peptidase M15